MRTLGTRETRGKGRSRGSDKAKKQIVGWNDKLLVSLLGVSLGNVYCQNSRELSQSSNMDQ